MNQKVIQATVEFKLPKKTGRCFDKGTRKDLSPTIFLSGYKDWLVFNKTEY